MSCLSPRVLYKSVSRGHGTLLMTLRYGCLVRGMAVSSGSCRCRVRLQSAAGWAEQSDRELGRAVGRGAGRSGRAAGLRGFASPDVLKYRLAIFGVPVANYSVTSTYSLTFFTIVLAYLLGNAVISKIFLRSRKIYLCDA